MRSSTAPTGTLRTKKYLDSDDKQKQSHFCHSQQAKKRKEILCPNMLL